MRNASSSAEIKSRTGVSARIEINIDPMMHEAGRKLTKEEQAILIEDCKYAAEVTMKKTLAKAN